jgi:hypothetical protein
MLLKTPATARDRLAPEAFEAKFVRATAEFLDIDANADLAFEIAVRRALDEIADARAKMAVGTLQEGEREPGLAETDAMRESSARWQAYAAAQRHAVRHPIALLEAEPRHELLREEILSWLLRLDYGMRAAAL